MVANSGGGVTRRAVLGGTAGVGLAAAFSMDLVGWAADLGTGVYASESLKAPRIHTRAQWRAKPPRRKAQVLGRAPDRIVVHHTATPNVTDYSVAHAYQLSRGIQRFHMQTRRWDDIGEQLTISRGGHVMEGRNRSLPAIRAGRHVVGAQTRSHNDHTIGIENEGTYVRTGIPSRLWSSLVETCAWLCTVYRLDPYAAIVGHRDLNPTDCPGDALYQRLPELRRTVAGRLGAAKPRVAAAAPPTPRTSPSPSASTTPEGTSPSVPLEAPSVVLPSKPVRIVGG